MPKSKNTKREIEAIESEVEIVGEKDDSAKGISPSTSNTFNQQNNFHLVQNIDLDKLSTLYDKSPDIANRVMDLYEKQQKHNVSIDNTILTLEKKEQKIRHDEIPYQRKFAFRSLNFAMGLSVCSLFAAGVFAYLKYPYLAGTAITIPIGVGVVNILGIKNTKQVNKTDKKNSLDE